MRTWKVFFRLFGGAHCPSPLAQTWGQSSCYLVLSTARTRLSTSRKGLGIDINPLAGILFISTRWFASDQLRLAREYQSPCGDSFHFNFDTARQFEIERESINPLAGILFISTLEPLIYDQYCEKYQSPCGDSFHFNLRQLRKSARADVPEYQSPCGDSFHFNLVVVVACAQQPVNPFVSIPLRGFFSFQPRSMLDRAHRRAGINPLAGILFISTQ